MNIFFFFSQEVGQLSLERPIAEANKCYTVLDGKLAEAYLELKCDPIVAATAVCAMTRVRAAVTAGPACR